MALLRKRPLTAREIGIRVAAGVTLVFVIGALCRVFESVVGLLQGKGLPKSSLLTYIGVAFALGLLYLLAEAVWYPIGKVLIEPDRVTDPLWKRFLRLVALLAIVSLVMAGGIYAENKGWLPARFAW
jgi:cation transporter-like permease